MSNDAAEWIPLFPEEEIHFILAAVLRSGARLKKSHETELENDLSDRLRDLLDQDQDFRERPVEIFREIPLYDRRRARQKQRGRADLLFLFSTGAKKPWPCFVIEAKRLNVTFPSGWQSLVSEYVTGDQGMMCFIEERYSTGLANGGMLGYVFDGDAERALNSVHKLIEVNREKLKCAKPLSLKQSSILGGKPGVSESIHSLARNVFVIYHLFLPV
ncbi:MAG: hypothetical protein JXA73_22875 [Acidobacteria bacterium]|nr:hypothetical protein [Acidobacteriota bacterium]